MQTNILNKPGYLSDEDRKEKLERGCSYFTFVTCLDLSIPVKIIPYGSRAAYTVNEYSRDLADFFTWWTHFVRPGLNSFSGFHGVKFELVGFTLVDNNQ